MIEKLGGCLDLLLRVGLVLGMYELVVLLNNVILEFVFVAVIDQAVATK